MYFMTSPATAMTMALSMMDEAARESRQQRRGRPVRASRRARRRPAVAMERPARRTGGLARVFGVAQ
jgi:hypothetical protein